MKKILVVFTIIAVILTGCGGKAKSNIVPAVAAQSILNNVTFRDTLMEAKGDVAKQWYGIDDKVSDFAIYISGSGATAEEIAVIKSSDVQAAKATIEQRVADLKLAFENYVPAEMTKLNDPVIVTHGDIAILVLADDTAQAQKAVDSVINAKK